MAFILGKEIYSHKKQLDEAQLNDIVQSYMNSIIFLRVCEDRNIEVYKTLLNFADNEDFNALIKNSGKLTENTMQTLQSALTEEIISNNRSAFWTIIKQLYFPESTYSFCCVRL